MYIESWANGRNSELLDCQKLKLFNRDVHFVYISGEINSISGINSLFLIALGDSYLNTA